ncbi:MAG: hypothetical protein H0X25_10210 [Acidobacteriales bacterium]|nr:hypothetical protein [Terriglobales bacterium]
MFRSTFVIAIVAIVLNCMALAVAQSGTYTQVDYPQAAYTFAYAINDKGEIVGAYVDDLGFLHGYLLSGGVFTPINFRTDYSDTVAAGINNVGQIVGWSLNGHGFLYDSVGKVFHALDYPGAVGTYPVSINNTGGKTGTFSFTGGVNELMGFQCLGSTCNQITPTGMPATVAGITDAAAVFGTLSAPFRFAHGRYQRFMIPGEPEARLSGVNFAGTALVGWMTPYGLRGFIYRAGVLRILNFPGSPNTQASGVNEDGVVVGTFFDSDGISHGFVWTPGEAPTNY